MPCNAQAPAAPPCQCARARAPAVPMRKSPIPIRESPSPIRKSPSPVRSGLRARPALKCLRLRHCTAGRSPVHESPNPTREGAKPSASRRMCLYCSAKRALAMHAAKLSPPAAGQCNAPEGPACRPNARSCKSPVHGGLCSDAQCAGASVPNCPMRRNPRPQQPSAQKQKELVWRSHPWRV